MLNFLIPDRSVLHLDAEDYHDQEIVLQMVTTPPAAFCPHCRSVSIRVCSACHRTIAGLPAGGCQGKVRLSIRRFFCDQASCTKRTFTERIPTVVAHYGRKATRLVLTQSWVGFVVGGEAGVRVSWQLALLLSPDTLLHAICKYPEPPPSYVKYLGVDDQAFWGNASYGTLLGDLETHRPIDLLYDRMSQTLAHWLNAHPEVQVVTRDRFTAYIEAIQQAVPQAVQVADRWHILHNLTDMLQRVLSKQYTLLQTTYREPRPTLSVPINPILEGIGDKNPQTIVRPPGPEDLYEVINERYEHGSILLTSNRAPNVWPDLFLESNPTGCPHLEEFSRQVTILDPAYPLFGRSFPLVRSASPRGKNPTYCSLTQWLTPIGASLRHRF